MRRGRTIDRGAAVPALALLLSVALLAALLAAPHGVAGAAEVSTGAPAAVGEEVPAGRPAGSVDPGGLPGPGGHPGRAFEGQPPPAGVPVWTGLRWDARTVGTADGRAVEVHIGHFQPDGALRLRPFLASGHVGGVRPAHQQAGPPLETGAVLGINGGFWLGDPHGEPDGFYAIDGRLVSEPASAGSSPRGTIGITAEGDVVIDRLGANLAVFSADGRGVPVLAVNRHHQGYDDPRPDGHDALLGFTTDFGRDVVVRRPSPPPPPPLPDHCHDDQPDPPPVPDPTGPTSDPCEPPPPEHVDLATLRLEGPPNWPITGRASATVTGIDRELEATYTVREHEILLVASGQRARALADVRVGDTLTVATDLLPQLGSDWTAVAHGVAGGPLIVADGAPTAAASWAAEGFSPTTHNDVRHPRTALGVTADGRVLMVVADGRAPDRSVGFTMAELAHYLVALGADRAVSLDGGGSSTFAVDGIVRNRPSDGTPRPVANSLFVVHDSSFHATSRIAGDGRISTAAAIARVSHPTRSHTAVLAAAGNFPDALAGGPLAAALRAPLLLVHRDSVPDETRAALRDLGVRQVWLLGGESMISPDVAAAMAAAGIDVRRLAGKSRVETSIEVARRVGAPDGRVFLATAATFPDALVASGPAGQLRMPILLSQGRRLHPAVAGLLATSAVSEVVVLGGPQAVGEAVVDDLERLGLDVTRLAGVSRYGTAAAILEWTAARTEVDRSRLLVAQGDAFPDALAGGALAAAHDVQLMTVPAHQIDADPAAAAFFAQHPATRVTILGGLGAVSSYQQLQLDQLALSSPEGRERS